MDPKAIQNTIDTEARSRELCKALEEGGTRFPDHLIAFSKNGGKH